MQQVTLTLVLPSKLRDFRIMTFGTLLIILHICLRATDASIANDQGGSPLPADSSDEMSNHIDYNVAQDGVLNKGESNEMQSLHTYDKRDSSRPRYDPGLKWLGLGKRLGPHINVQFLTGLRKLFETNQRRAAEDEYISRKVPREDISNNPLEDNTVGLGAFPKKNSLSRFNGNSKNGKNLHLYDPSWMWFGLGKK